MNKAEIINEINLILDEKEIDERVKPLIKLFFLGKADLDNLNIKQIKSQIDILCIRIKNVEFTSSDKIVTAYEKKANVLTINKQLFLDGKSDEIILPIFMKFEEALNQNNRRPYGSHVEDFINAGRIAKSISIPISNRLYKLYEMAEYCYGDIEDKLEDLIKDSVWKGTCLNYNKVLNEMIITGTDDQKALLDGLRLFYNEVFSYEALKDSDYESPYKTEEYQKKASKILACIDCIKPKKYMMLFADKDTINTKNVVDTQEKNRFENNIELFTGCNREMIEIAKSQQYTGDLRISNILKETFIKENKQELTEEFIINRVQELIDRKPEWDNRVKHLIIPFFIRSQKVYNWDLDEFQERVNELDLKIDKIIFKELESLTIMGDTSGNKIRLNSRVFLNKKREIVWPLKKTVFHEVAHITDENEREGIKIKEALQLPLIGQYYEWSNTVSERLLAEGKLYRKNDAMQLTDAGYEALAPLGSMVACALGMPEIEFAKIKDKGKDYETKLLESMFPIKETIENKDSKNEYGTAILKKVKDIFNQYNLDTSFSLNKKQTNQNLLNELYAECLKIMKIRIENELQNGSIENMEEYKKYQMFYLKKMNFNFRNASKSKGFRFSKTPIVHDIGFCNDKMTTSDFDQIAQEHISMTEFDFDNNLGKYNKAMTLNEKDEFNKRLRFFKRRKEIDKSKVSSSKEQIVKNEDGIGENDDGLNI